MFKPLLTQTKNRRRLLSPAVPPLPVPATVTVRGEDRPLRVRFHGQAKRMILRFDARSGDGRLTVPVGTPPSTMQTFLLQSRGWIDANAPVLPEPNDMPHPTILPILGVDHRIVPTGMIRGTVTRNAENELHVPGTSHRVMPRLAQYLKTQAEQYLTPSVMSYAEALGRSPAALRFRDPRSQWGSCNANRVITLSWRVIMAPPEAQSYLAAHEVAHLKEMNHSARFWQTVAALEPNWRAGQKALKSVEKELLAIRFS